MAPHRYLLLMLASAATCLGLAWAWTASMPMRFMEPEYAAWQAKLVMLASCDLGDTLVLGDSRAAADIMPGRLPGRVTNLAIGGGEAIEALALLRRALACPDPPHRVILSFDAGHFSRPDLFWERSVRFGFLSPADIDDLRRITAETGDSSVYLERHTGLLPARLRDWLRLTGFPSYDFARLLHGGGFLRGPRNQQMLETTLRQRGQYSFGTAPGSHEVAIEGHLPDFVPLPVLDRYFDTLLATLDQHAMDAVFLPMPVNEATYRQVDPALKTGFTAYLQAYAERYPRFHLIGEIIPHRPDAEFGDGFCHMNPEAAEHFSDELAQRLQAAPPNTQNDAQYGWFSGTGREASANVEPNSKRGS